MAMAITLAQALALACIAGITGKVGDGEDVVVLVTAVVGGVSKPIIICLNFLYLYYHNISYW
jgi:hypothetical protein